MSEFHQQFYCHFPDPKPNEAFLMEKAFEYHARTEKFDSAVCRIKDEHGIAVPTCGEEWSLCNRNAQKTRDRMFTEEIEPMGVQRYQWMRAIQRMGKRVSR